MRRVDEPPGGDEAQRLVERGVIARRVRVFGRVQGVFFRAFTKDAAQSQGVGGRVRNLDDGSVEAILEGEPLAVQRVIERMREGPPGSRVVHVEVEEETPAGLTGPFVIDR